MSYPNPARRIGLFSIEAFGGDSVELADLDGDGQYEMLVLQTAGQFCAQNFRDRDDLDEVDQSLYCLTAVSLAGEVLWQDGVPYERAFPFTSHGVQGGNLMLCVDDIDLDGRPEVIVIRHGELALLEARTGRQVASVALPADNITNVFTAQLGSPEAGRQILCKANDRAYPPWEYANPVVVYNPDLSVYREPFAVKGAGHNLVVRDVDGNGRDELLIGYSLLDHGCNALWTLDFGPDFDYAREHADHIDISDLDGDGRPEVRYAGSVDFFVADIEGRVRWTFAAGHSQRSISGAWGPAGETRILMAEKNLGLWGLDAGGRSLWNRKDLNGYAIADVRWPGGGERHNWALFRPQLKPISPTPYESDPAWSEEIWPFFLDGDGTRLDVFPWQDEYAQPSRHIRASRSYDCGVKYYALVRDLDGDGLDEVILHDRDRVWIFHG